MFYREDARRIGVDLQVVVVGCPTVWSRGLQVAGKFCQPNSDRFVDMAYAHSCEQQAQQKSCRCCCSINRPMWCLAIEQLLNGWYLLLHSIPERPARAQWGSHRSC